MRHLLLSLAVLVSLALPAWAQLAPDLGYVFPAGGKAGTTVEVRLGGYDWTPDMQFFAIDPRVKLEVLGPPGDLLMTPPPFWFGPRSRLVSMPIAREVPARFVLPADLPPGPIRWQAANANGATPTGFFYVGTGPEIVEDERRKGPQTLPALPVTVSGRLFKNEEVDSYRFTAAKAGPVTVELMARRLGANFHGVLEVRDREGRLLTEAVDTEGIDPALTFAATAGTDYILRVRDIDHAGDRSFVYRLAVTPGPRVLAAIPAAGKRGETRAVEFVGIGVATGAARLESVQKQVTFPASPTLASFDYRLETPHGIAPPHALFLSDVPEFDPAAGFAKRGGPPVKPLTLPSAVTGILDQPNAEDTYLLTGKKGERWVIRAEARRFGSPLDVTLVLRGPDGKELVRNEDLPGTTDAGLDFTVPADGSYQLVVSDTAGAAGSRAAIYRLVVRRPADDFTLTTTTQRLSVPTGTKTNLALKATRLGAFKGPIAVTLAGLPVGVTVPANLVIPADKVDLAIALEAAANAPSGATLVTVTGSADVAGARVTRPLHATTTGTLTPRSPEENETTTLLIASTLKPRVKGDVVDKDTGRKVPRGSTFPADVTLARLEGYQGEIVLLMAARQSYQMQGATGRDVTVPAGVTRTAFPCYMPEWMETSRTSRMGISAVVKVPDPRGTVRHLVAPVTGFVTMTMEGAMLKLSHEGRELASRPGQSLTVRLRIARSAKLPEPVRLELLPSEELPGLLKAEPIVVPAGLAEVDYRIAITNDPRLTGDQTFTIRATAMQPGNLAVISETTVQVAFPPPTGK